MPNLKKKIKKTTYKLAHRNREAWDFKVRMEILVVVIAISLFVIITTDNSYYNDFNQILAVFFSAGLILYLLKENN
jgi:hypothetical protein